MTNKTHEFSIDKEKQRYFKKELDSFATAAFFLDEAKKKGHKKQSNC